MFNTTEPRYKIKTLKSGDKDFTFSPDGVTLVSRASIVISQRCPENYKDLILECINHGWLKPVAHMKESEFIWEKLGE
jgi:hypothetical protein